MNKNRVGLRKLAQMRKDVEVIEQYSESSENEMPSPVIERPEGVDILECARKLLFSNS